MKGKISL